MADELIITGQFDPNAIVEGINQAASAVQAGTEEISASFEQVASSVIPSEEAIQGAGQAATGLLVQLGAISDEASVAAPSLTSLGSAASVTADAIASFAASSEGVTNLLSQLTGLSEAELGASEAAVALQVALAGAGAGADNLLRQLGQTSENLQIVSTITGEVDEKITAASLGFSSAAEASQAFSVGLNAAGGAASNLLSRLGALGEEEQLAFQGFEQAQLVTPTISLLSEAVLELQLHEQALVDLQAAVSSSIESVATTTTQAAEQLLLFSESSESSARNTVTLAEATDTLVNAEQRLVNTSREVASIQSNLSSSAGEYVAALQEQAAAQEEVVAAQQTLTDVIAELQAQLISEQETLTSLNSSWAEYVAAEGEAAIITEQLAQAQALLATQAQATAQAVSTSATATQSVNIVSAQTTQVLGSLATILAQTGLASNQTAGAMQLLGSNAALAANGGQQVTAAVNTLNTVLQRLNLQLQGTAGNLNLVRVAATGVGGAAQGAAGGVNTLNQSLSQSNGALAYVAGRLGAFEVGLGNVGFAVGMLARTSAGLGSILIAAFPVIAAIALFDVVSNLDSKFTKFQDSIRKTGIEFDDLAESIGHEADSIELQNLKLEDQIAKLEGRPEPNHLKEALLEAKEAADQLNKSLQNSIEKSIELMEKEGETLHALGEFFLQGVATSADIPGKLRDPLISVEEAIRSNTRANDDLYAAKNRVNQATGTQIANSIDLNEIEKKYNTTAGEQKDAYYQLWLATVNRTHSLVALKEAQKAVNAVTDEELSKIPKSSMIDYGPRRLELERVKDAVNNLVTAEDNEGKHADLLLEKAKLSAVVHGSVSRSAEEAARRQLQIDDLVAENAFNKTKQQADVEAAAAIQGGAERLEVEQATISKLEVAEEALTTSKIQAQQKFLTAMEAALDKEEHQTQTRKKGTARTEGLEDISTRRTLVEEQVEAEITKIKEEGVDKRTQLDKQGGAAFTKETEVELAEVRKNSTEYIEILTKAINTIIAKYPLDLDAFRNLQKQKSEAVKAFNLEQAKIGSIDAQITRDEETAKLEIFRRSTEEQYSLGLISNSKRIQSLRDVTDQEFKIQLDEAEAVRDQYDQNTSAYEEAERRRLQIANRYAQAVAAIDNEELKERVGRWAKFEGSIISGFGNATSELLRAQKTFGQGLAEEWNNMVVQFTQYLESMVLKWILDHTLMQVVSKVFHVQDVTVHAASETAKTAATAAGETTRTTIISAHTIQHATLKTTETSHHIASEITKTASTIGHEAIRMASTIAHFVKKLIFGTQETAKAVADDASKTASAVTTNAVVLASTLTTNAAILTSNIATSIGSIAADKAAGAARIGTEVALAGAGGVASMAAAPFPIDLGAPAFGAAMAGLAASYGAALVLSEGGHVAGPGTSTSDSIPAKLSDGEYVIKADSARKIGLPLLNLINKGESLHINNHAFAQGGLVGSLISRDTGRLLDSVSRDMPIFAHTSEMASNISRSDRQVSTSIEGIISERIGTGSALDTSSQHELGRAFGSSFSSVEIHTDSAADKLNRSLGAAAFTVGNSIFFSQGAYSPSTLAGKELLAHELTHVVQNNGGSVSRSLTLSHPSDSHEVDARNVAASYVASISSASLSPLISGHSLTSRLSLSPTGEIEDSSNVVREHKVAGDSLRVGSALAEASRIEFLKDSILSHATGVASTLTNTINNSRLTTASSASHGGNKTTYIQPEISYHQHGSGPSMAEFHDTVVKIIKSAGRKGQLNFGLD